MTTGVYRIRNTVDGKVYVGSAIDIARREEMHFRDLRTGRHRNLYLQRAFVKYGVSAFVLDVLEECTVEVLIERERSWMETLGALDRQRGYNIMPAGEFRNDWTPESRAKLSRSKRGTTFSPEARRRMSEAAKRRAATPAGRARLIELSLRNANDPETKARMAETLRARARTEDGRTQYVRMSALASEPEAKEKRAAQLRGRKTHKWTTEQRARVGAAHRALIASGLKRIPDKDPITGRFVSDIHLLSRR